MKNIIKYVPMNMNNIDDLSFMNIIKYLPTNDLMNFCEIPQFENFYNSHQRGLTKILKYNNLIDLIGYDLIKWVPVSEYDNITGIVDVYIILMEEIIQKINNRVHINDEYYLELLDEIIMREKIMFFMHKDDSGKYIFEDLDKQIKKYENISLFKKLYDKIGFEINWLL